jgi:hypothetical protein
MKNATLADLVISARNAGQKAFEADDALTQQTTKLAEFKASGFDSADFPTWEQAFNSEIDMLNAFSVQDSPATTAAKKLAASAPATPAPKAPAPPAAK